MRLLICVLLSLSASLSWAAVDVREFRNDAEEARYRALTEELRCPKCQNTNLAGSDAGLAGDLKDRVYEQVRAGRSDQEIRDYLIARYGDFITYKPPVRGSTLLLWWGPGIVLAVAALMLVLRARRKPVKGKPLTPAEQQRLQALLTDGPESESRS